MFDVNIVANHVLRNCAQFVTQWFQIRTVKEPSFCENNYCVAVIIEVAVVW